MMDMNRPVQSRIESSSECYNQFIKSSESCSNMAPQAETRANYTTVQMTPQPKHVMGLQQRHSQQENLADMGAYFS